MRFAALTIAFAALAATLVAPVLHFAGTIDLDLTKRVLTVATLAWFVAAPLGMSARSPADRQTTIPNED